MLYLKHFLTGFFIVFFVNYLLPGVDVISQSKIPHLGGDLLFAAILGLLNSIVYPLLRAFDRNATMIRAAVVLFIVNFLSYALLKLLPFGVYVTSVQGYFTASLAVSVGSILLAYAQFRRLRNSA